MFQKSKTNYKITAECSVDDKSGTYTFTVSYDENWSDIAEQLFYDEFGEYPSCLSIISRETI